MVRHASAGATVYRRYGDVIVVGEQELDDGMKVAGPPFLRLPSRLPVEVGAAVARALRENRSGVVMADEEAYERTWQPVLDAAGVASNAEFHCGMCAAEVSAWGAGRGCIEVSSASSDARPPTRIARRLVLGAAVVVAALAAYLVFFFVEGNLSEGALDDCRATCAGTNAPRGRSSSAIRRRPPTAVVDLQAPARQVSDRRSR